MTQSDSISISLVCNISYDYGFLGVILAEQYKPPSPVSAQLWLNSRDSPLSGRDFEALGIYSKCLTVTILISYCTIYAALQNTAHIPVNARLATFASCSVTSSVGQAFSLCESCTMNKEKASLSDLDIGLPQKPVCQDEVRTQLAAKCTADQSANKRA